MQRGGQGRGVGGGGPGGGGGVVSAPRGGGPGRQVGRDVLAPEGGGRRDDEAAGSALRADRERILGRCQLVEDAVTILVEGGPFRRERHLAGGALEQFHAQALFQLVDPPSDHR